MAELYGVAFCELFLRRIGLERVLFGTDHPLFSYARYFEFLDEMDFSDCEVEMIGYENAARLLGLESFPEFCLRVISPWPRRSGRRSGRTPDPPAHGRRLVHLAHNNEGDRIDMHGGDERIRTADLRVANAALSQLSYIPGIHSKQQHSVSPALATDCSLVLASGCAVAVQGVEP